MKRAQRWFLLVVLSLVTFLPVHARAQSASSEIDNNPFPLLAGLEQPVEFWTKIFTEYSISQLVFFDPLEMSKIYEVLDVGEENRSNEYVDGERARIAAAHEVSIERVKAQRGVRERTAAGLKRSNRYIAQMQQIFRERGLPVELTYLPLIESSFNSNARSHAGALGMWQFMPATGRQYMRVDRAIDERKDPIESTRAAASFLKQAYESLGNWPLAITAYNFGPGGMARAVAEVGSDNLVDVIQKYNSPYFGYPPKNFYAEFLVAVDIGKNPERYFPALLLDPPVTIQEVELRSKSSLAAVMRSTGLKRDEFLEWNPALANAPKIIPAGYRVKLPAQKQMAAIVEVRDVSEARETPARQQAQSSVVRHRVKRGETLLQIARRYGTSAERILRINGLRKGNLLRAGSTVLVPRL
jgi:membrane-bound lytic murein transglycosylase D